MAFLAPRTSTENRIPLPPSFDIDPEDVFDDLQDASGNRIIMIANDLVDAETGNILNDSDVCTILEYMGSPPRVRDFTIRYLDSI